MTKIKDEERIIYLAKKWTENLFGSYYESDKKLIENSMIDAFREAVSNEELQLEEANKRIEELEERIKERRKRWKKF